MLYDFKKKILVLLIMVLVLSLSFSFASASFGDDENLKQAKAQIDVREAKVLARAMADGKTDASFGGDFTGVNSIREGVYISAGMNTEYGNPYLEAAKFKNLNSRQQKELQNYIIEKKSDANTYALANWGMKTGENVVAGVTVVGKLVVSGGGAIAATATAWYGALGAKTQKFIKVVGTSIIESADDVTETVVAAGLGETNAVVKNSAGVASALGADTIIAGITSLSQNNKFRRVLIEGADMILDTKTGKYIVKKMGTHAEDIYTYATEMVSGAISESAQPLIKKSIKKSLKQTAAVVVGVTSEGVSRGAANEFTSKEENINEGLGSELQSVDNRYASYEPSEPNPVQSLAKPPVKTDSSGDMDAGVKTQIIVQYAEREGMPVADARVLLEKKSADYKLAQKNTLDETNSESKLASYQVEHYTSEDLGVTETTIPQESLVSTEQPEDNRVASSNNVKPTTSNLGQVTVYTGDTGAGGMCSGT